MKDSTYQWLPDRHLGVAATLAHADEIIGRLTDVLYEYQRQPDGIIVLREEPAGDHSRTVVDRVAPMPRKIPLLVADALVALRAALEHALFAEVEFMEGAPLEERAARLVDIPAAENFDAFAEWTRKKAKNGPASLQAGTELVRRLEQLQPFQRTTDPAQHPLARLVLHTNHAKHRTPAVTAVRLVTMYRDDETPRSLRDVAQRPEEPLRVDDVIAETPMGERVPVTLFPSIGLNRPGTDRWPVLMTELAEIADWVRAQAVPRLITGAEPMEPALPAHYEIAVGHADERRALIDGSMTTSEMKYKERLGATSARMDVPEWLSQMDGAPQAPQVSQWLDQLSDAEVLERVGRLTPSIDHDTGIMRRNVEVLEALRDEAAAFAERSEG
ncbi:hypothetical protein [Isoptericola sp. NPDC019482]|uniref:hypothetical protein n=1 Tax=Isoptericola sp. NPDC019482 TaxID=3154688 RepID=UPI0034935626